LDRLLAPVALYPDQLLAQILLSTSDPPQVAALSKWLESNQNLKGSALQDAALVADFAPSLVALVLFPDVVHMMTVQLQWTTRLGEVFAADRAAVFDAIQRLRAQAQSVGTLKDTPQQEVETQTTSSGQEVIVIEPANPQVVYVPQYDPQVVYTQPATTTVVVQEDNSADAVAAGLIGFTAGIAIGAAMDNDYYYGPYGWYGGAYMYNDAWDDYYDAREDAREDWMDHREDLSEERTDRLENQQEQRTDRQENRQENRPETQAQRQERRSEAQATASGTRSTGTSSSSYERRSSSSAAAAAATRSRDIRARDRRGPPARGARAAAPALAVAAGGAGERRAGGENMRKTMTALRSIRCVNAATVLIAITCVSWAVSLAPLEAAQRPAQPAFATPEDAVRALIEAAKAGERDALLALFGPEAQDLVASSDPATARRNREVFIVAVAEEWRLLDDESGGKTLVIGHEAWPFPIPLTNAAGGWRFDTAAGREEVIARRIGRNELAAIQVSRTYVDAQRRYAQAGHDGKATGLYARTFQSDPGKENGLYWPFVRGHARSPLGDLVAQAAEEGRPLGAGRESPSPLRGYYFKILTGQGVSAPGGAKSYIVDGEMSAGFALVAWPAQYDVTGIMTFIVNQDGTIYEKDLGPGTDAAARSMIVYDPDQSWTPVP
jgi:hypothetical protein